ncbi:hypothetical protein [Treponema sp.]|uniref:hypothetical protein n=1 Tax=Treponema sp. TaxID=166 RepID=UPI00388FA3A3
MFDKLGDLLSEALEKGELPESKGQFSDFFEEPDSKITSSPSQPYQQKSLPADIKNAFSFIGISEEADFNNAKKIYREKLMYYHPDRRNENPVLQKVAKEKTEQLLREWEKVEKWYSGT